MILSNLKKSNIFFIYPFNIPGFSKEAYTLSQKDKEPQ